MQKVIDNVHFYHYNHRNWHVWAKIISGQFSTIVAACLPVEWGRVVHISRCGQVRIACRKWSFCGLLGCDLQLFDDLLSSFANKLFPGQETLGQLMGEDLAWGSRSRPSSAVFTHKQRPQVKPVWSLTKILRERESGGKFPWEPDCSVRHSNPICAGPVFPGRNYNTDMSQRWDLPPAVNTHHKHRSSLSSLLSPSLSTVRK